ncbi:ABC transporter permease [Saccharospirillum mangrovi]|uniref:ABC transporter permease n=1 Tax=Saccharospirillum mangrovi TaxID=2161747 RepID=UPI000D3A355D|nr:ABC transporter permease [Saccharospirillum mangrovi]
MFYSSFTSNLAGTLRFPLNDVASAFRLYRIWMTLGWNDILARYRRSVLGPLWLTISMAVTIAVMGPLYGSIFNIDIRAFMPHLSLGLIAWGFISAQLIEFGEIFQHSAHYLRNMKLPLSLFILRVQYRQLIILAHNLAIIPVLFLILGLPIHWTLLLVIPALVLIGCNFFFIGLIISFFCTRYRDMQPVLTSLMNLFFFVTPIVWHPDQLSGQRRFIAELNPLAVYVDLIRAPFLGQVPSLHEWGFALGSAVVLLLAALYLLKRSGHRLVYWL